MSESSEQIALFEWAAYNEQRLPELALLFHVPNGGYRDWQTAKRLLAEGVKSGILDLWLPVARHGYHGLVIEMKTTGGRVSPAQQQWIDALRVQGYRVVVCWQWLDAVHELEMYLDTES
jgi:hypothetical protein